ncbi:efflux RND transporter periplasmic adaptor subunit [soil metagenome]
MLKKLGIAGVILMVFALIIFILIQNKTKSQEKLKVGNDYSKAVPVNVTDVSVKEIDNKLSIIGTINASKEVTVGAETIGRVTAVSFSEGQFVSKGRILASIDSESKRLNIQNAQNNYDKAKNDLARYEQLSIENATTDVQVESYRFAFKSAETQLLLANRQLKDAYVKAPMSGYVTIKNVEKGSIVSTGSPVATIVDISSLKVKVNVSETDVFQLKVGDPAEITTDVYPGKIFFGKITAIIAKGDEAHTYPVEITVPNEKTHPLKAGMFGKANFTSLQNRRGLVIPREALVGSIKDPKVFIIVNNVAKLVSISTGAEGDLYIEVTSGLKEGDKVVTNGTNNLKDNIEVKVITQ